MCVYCGVKEATTVDHVIPKCIFLRPLPSNMLTVPACEGCNTSKSNDDDYLRDMLVIDRENEPHPMSQGELKSKVIRSIKRNSSHLVREGRRTRQITPFHSPGGLYLGSAPAIPIEQARVDRMFGRIVRGLYLALSKGTRLPMDCPLEVGKVHALAKDQTIALFDRPGARMYAIGDSFQCAYIVAKDRPTASLWLLRFLNVFVVVTTGVDDVGNKTRPMTSWLD